MKAVIVAAGRSSRLYPLTLETPKSLLPVSGEVSMLERSVGFFEQIGIREIIVVVGFHAEKIQRALGDRVKYVVNPFYESTNNLGSLWLALPYLVGNDFIYSHSDIIYHQSLLSTLVNNPAKAAINLIVDYDSVDAEAMKIRVENGQFIESDKGVPLDQAAGEWIGLARIDQSAITPLTKAAEQILSQKRLQDYDTAAFNLLASQESAIFELLSTEGLPWAEVDTEVDLVQARTLFEQAL